MDDKEKVRVEAKPLVVSKRTFTVIICVAVALLLAFGGIGIAVGYNAAGTRVTVIHSTDTPVSKLSATDESSIVNVVEAIADSVVEIKCTVTVQSSGGWFQRPTTYSAKSSGSGVILGSDGTIVTNHHVIEGATDITVTLRNGKQYSAKLVGSDAVHDIAVIKISADGLTYASFGQYTVKVGQTVVVIGNPLGSLGGSVTDGIISALDRDIVIDGVTMRLLQTNASINSGNSGGGMFDLDGNLIGIVNAKSTGENVEGLGFAIPASIAQQAVTDILEKN